MKSRAVYRRGTDNCRKLCFLLSWVRGKKLWNDM